MDLTTGSCSLVGGDICDDNRYEQVERQSGLLIPVSAAGTYHKTGTKESLL